ncbi:Signal recognition particle protein [Balamuthia mandrillaris]
MVYISSWDSFYEAAEALYTKEPTRTRYVIKYRHNEGKLVLKVTDDNTCLKYKATYVQGIKKMEKLNKLFLRAMTEKSK